ncbi:hypothetical protein HK104_004114, partial [Borealophlyctis nickersoniae]
MANSRSPSPSHPHQWGYPAQAAPAATTANYLHHQHESRTLINPHDWYSSGTDGSGDYQRSYFFEETQAVHTGPTEKGPTWGLPVAPSYSHHVPYGAMYMPVTYTPHPSAESRAEPRAAYTSHQSHEPHQPYRFQQQQQQPQETQQPQQPAQPAQRPVYNYTTTSATLALSSGPISPPAPTSTLHLHRQPTPHLPSSSPLSTSTASPPPAIRRNTARPHACP